MAEEISRRRFLGAAAGTAALPQVLLDALAASAAGAAHDIEHVVIFMQENRSFDHYFGSLNGVRGFRDRNAITLPSGKPVWYQPYSNLDGRILPFHLDTKVSKATCSDAAAMSWPVDLGVWHGGKRDAWNTARQPALGMGYYQRQDLDFYYQIANAFTICDHYFQSTLT